MKDDDRRQLWNAVGMVSSLGLHMVASIAVGLFLGRFADDRLGTAPWGAIWGIVLGMLAGVWTVYKKVTGKS